jgi:hypothetical protein
MHISLKHLMVVNSAGAPLLLIAVQRLRTLPLPAFRAFRVNQVAAALSAEWTNLAEIKNAAIKRLAPEGADQLEPGTDAMKAFIAEMTVLGEQPIALPIPEKIKLPGNIFLSALDLELLEPICELEAES